MNTFRLLFSGPTGDSEQTVPGFVAAGLDLADYVEWFARKPYLIVSTEDDFFPLEGARAVFQEARAWYGLYNSEERVTWAIGPGGHGTPHEVRERIYEWMIRWLKDGKGDFREEAVQAQPDFKLFASEAGQVGGRDIYEVIGDDFRRRQSSGTQEQMLAEIARWAQIGERKAPAARVLSETADVEFKTQQLAIEVEPRLEIAATLSIPSARGRKPAVILVNGVAASAAKLAKEGVVALKLTPRSDGPASANWRLLGGCWRHR